jgi:hypothetical protein
MSRPNGRNDNDVLIKLELARDLLSHARGHVCHLCRASGIEPAGLCPPLLQLTPCRLLM